MSLFRLPATAPAIVAVFLLTACKPADQAKISGIKAETEQAERLYQELSVELSGLGSELNVAGGSSRIIADETTKLREKQRKLRKDLAALESVCQSIIAQTEEMTAARAEFKKNNP